MWRLPLQPAEEEASLVHSQKGSTEPEVARDLLKAVPCGALGKEAATGFCLTRRARAGGVQGALGTQKGAWESGNGLGWTDSPFPSSSAKAYNCKEAKGQLVSVHLLPMGPSLPWIQRGARGTRILGQ